jgi:hypothetical protein
MRRTTILLFLLLLAIYGMWMLVIYLYGVNIPILDQWILPGEQIEKFFQNQLCFASIYRKYNESRKVFPNIIFIITTVILKEWNVKAEMLLGLHFAFLMSILIYFLLKLTNKSFFQNLSISIVYCSLLLSPFSFSRWLRGITLHRLIPDACLIVNALIFRLKINQHLKTCLYSLFCIIAQYSFAGGIVIWLVSSIFIIFNDKMTLRSRFISIALFILLFELSTQFYFQNYIHPSYHTEISEINNLDFQDIIIYFCAFFGSIFGNSYTSSAFIGILLLFTFILLLVLNYSSFRCLKEEITPWAALGFYTIVLGVLNSITRAPMSYNHAIRIDYISHLVYLSLSILVIFINETKYKKTYFIKCYFLSLLGIISAFYIYKNSPTKTLDGLQEWQRQYSYGKSCIQLINFYQKDDCIKVLFPFVDLPYPWKLDLVITRFRKLSELNVLKPGIVKDIKIHNQEISGYIDLLQEDANGFFKINGWVKLPTRVADAVIL